MAQQPQGGGMAQQPQGGGMVQQLQLAQGGGMAQQPQQAQRGGMAQQPKQVQEGGMAQQPVGGGMAQQPEGGGMAQGPPQPDGGGMANRRRGYGVSKTVEELRNGMLVAAALVATLAFQAAITPPGGLWQDDLIVAPNKIHQKNHTAGNPIWRDKYPSAYRRFQILNVLAFVVSIGTIVLTLLSALMPGLQKIPEMILPTFCAALLMVAAIFAMAMRQQEN